MASNWKSWLPSRNWLVIPPVLLGIACIVYFAATREPLPRLEPVEMARQLPITTVQLQTINPTATGYGTARAVRTWTAVAEVKGQVKRINPDLESGVAVQADDVLVEIDDRDYQLQLAQRESDLVAAKARVDELEASLEADRESLAIEENLLQLNKSEWERIKNLGSSRAVSPADIDQARGVYLRQSQSVQSLRNALRLYPAKLASAKAAVSLAQSRVDEAQRNLDRTVIRAPFAGILSGVDVEEGQFVGQNQSLFLVMDNSTIEVSAQFSLSQLARLYAPQRSQNKADIPSSISTDLLKELSASVTTRSGDLALHYQAVPVRISESIDEVTRTLGVVVQVDRQQLAAGGVSTASLRPGAFCEVILTGQPAKDLIVVPASALDGDSVFVVDEGSRLKRVNVSTGARYGDQVVIVSGLQPEQRLVTDPPVPAIEGLLVKANNAKTEMESDPNSPADGDAQK